jgi:starch-binding outer membrane protein, SusD/RagB family
MNQKSMLYVKRTILVYLFLAVLSCSEDFLDKPLQGRLTQDSFPTTADDALLATNAIYNTLRINSYNQGLFPILDIMSDDGSKGSNPADAASDVGAYNTFDHVPTEGNISRWWYTLYLGVKRANVVLEKVPTIEMDETLKERYVGEASFLRALFYFDLVRAWGGVPLFTTTTPSVDLTRAEASEVYALIESDLLTAITNLPEKSEYDDDDMGRATKGAARGLLAKVYLFMDDYVNAEKYALEVINSGQYDLMPDFADANSEAGIHGVESVFEVGALPFENFASGGNQYANVQGVRGTPNRGWGFNRPTLDLINSFEAGDPRLEATVIYLGETLDGVLISGDGETPDETTDGDGNVIEKETYNQKVWTPGTNVPSQFNHNRRILRFADVLLIAAEALNQNNKPTDALVYLNRVRERARGGNGAVLPDIVTTNKEELDDIIFDERRHELALESHRLWDLIRTERAAEVLGPLGFETGKHELLPIPQSEIDLTNKRITQNPKW